MIQEQIKADTIVAMKAKDMLVLNTLRGLSSEIKNYEINELRLKGLEITENDVIKVLQKEVKKRKESIEIFNQAGRSDLADKEAIELKVIEKYLPTQMSKEEIDIIVSDVISNMEGDYQFGEVMKIVMVKLGGKADGKLVSESVKAHIQQ